MVVLVALCEDGRAAQIVDALKAVGTSLSGLLQPHHPVTTLYRWRPAPDTHPTTPYHTTPHHTTPHYTARHHSPPFPGEGDGVWRSPCRLAPTPRACRLLQNGLYSLCFLFFCLSLSLSFGLSLCLGHSLSLSFSLALSLHSISDCLEC